MTSTTKPDKQVVRDYLGRVIKEKEPPPSPEQVRRELGWYLLESKDSKSRD